MNYNLNLFKENNFECSWKTLYVGRKLGLISHSIVTDFALKIVEDNEDVDNTLILELAWDLEEDESDRILEILINQIYGSIIYEKSAEWDIEKRKWRYCALSEISKRINNEQAIYQEVEEVFSVFKYPSDMSELFRNISDEHFYSQEKQKDIVNHMKNMISEFLEREKFELNIRS